MQTLPKRSEIPKDVTWDLESIYPTDEQWEQDMEAAEALTQELAAQQGRLGEGAAALADVLELSDRVGMLIERLYVYAHMRSDEDAGNNKYQAYQDRAASLASRAGAASAYIVPEILALPPATLAAYQQEERRLQVYEHYLSDINRQREHVRSAEVEALLAETGEIARGPRQIYTMLHDADMTFPVIEDEKGQPVELTKGRFIPQFMESHDRSVRERAYEAFYGTFREHTNTITATLAAAVKSHVFYARARRHESSLAAALFGNNIPVSVYSNLTDTVRKNLPLMHRYTRLRKRALGVDQLRFWDLYVPLVAEAKQEYTYEQAVDTVCKALAPLGETYVSDLRKGFESRWVDVMENVGKHAGAYSSGTYTTHPFVLLNYQPNLDNVFTIAHEMGHSMHSFYTRKSQPYIYGDYSIFVAEVASTLNEQLLTHYLLQQTDDPKLRRYLLNHLLDSFRMTLYRQTLFAEFERQIHEEVEQGGALTAELMCEHYAKLNAQYYGPDIDVDENIAHEWMRIPHFYTNYYVYQYATGLSAAVALSRQILSEGEPAVQRYLKFLSSGSSDYPINVLKLAGVDMTTPQPVQQALDGFAETLDEMERLL